MMTRGEESLDKLRFLIQSRVVDDDLYDQLMAMDSSARINELTAIWDTGGEHKNIKIKVKFTYLEAAGDGVSSVSSNATHHSLQARLRIIGAVFGRVDVTEQVAQHIIVDPLKGDRIDNLPVNSTTFSSAR